jgi:hypothetical protein
MPDAFTDQVLEFRGEGIAIDVIMEHFAKLYKVDTDIDLELQLRNIRQDESETGRY